MKREEASHTPEGQAAWRFYQQWLSKHRRKPRGMNSFLTSHYYKPFMRFAEFVKTMSLSDPNYFMDFVILKKYDPKMWTDDRVYRAYLEFLDRNGDPLDCTATTIKAIQKYTNEVGCKFGEIFDYISAPELIHKIYYREFSPWLLLHSPKFQKFYITQMNSSDRIRLDGVIRQDFWKERIKKYPNANIDIKNIVKRLNL